MSFSFEFRTAETRRDLERLLDFLRKQDLNYPGYQDWIERTQTDLETGYKTGVIAVSNSLIIGNVIWQPHKQIKGIREIKNMRIHPSVRQRYFARFLMKQAEVENPKEYSVLMCDLREDHPERSPLNRMLFSMGYRELNTDSLYDPNVRDIVMIKDKLA